MEDFLRGILSKWISEIQVFFEVERPKVATSTTTRSRKAPLENLHSKGWPFLIFPKNHGISSHWWIKEIPDHCQKHIQTPQIRRVQWFLGLFDLCMFFVLLQLYSYHVVGPYFHHHADPLDFVIELHNILILIIPILTTARCLTQRMLHLARSLRQSVDMRDGFDKFYGPELRWFFQFPVSQADHPSRIVPLELLMK